LVENVKLIGSTTGCPILSTVFAVWT